VASQEALVRKDLVVEDLGTPPARRRMTRAYVYKDPANGDLRLFMSLHADNGLVGDPRAAAMGPTPAPNSLTST